MTSKVKIKWNDIIPLAIKAARSYKKEVGTASNLRGLFYALVSTGVLPNTRGAYKGLSKCLSKARKRGLFPWNLLQDSTRPTFNREKSPITLESLERWGDEYATDALEEIRDQVLKIQNPDFSYSAFKWEGQKKRVVICCEKEGGAKAIASLTRKWKVEVNATRGYSSTTNVRELALRLHALSEIESVEELEVILVTDYDPSGEDIVRFMRETLRYDFGIEANVHKVLVTRAQIDEHELPSTPEDADERAKMMRDPRFKNWDDGFFRVELDAMLAIVPDSFRSVLNEAVAVHFDENVEAQVKERTEEIREEAEEKMKGLEARLGDLPQLVQNLLDEFEVE